MGGPLRWWEEYSGWDVTAYMAVGASPESSTLGFARSKLDRNKRHVKWWAHQDLNLEPKHYECSALTVEL